MATFSDDQLALIDGQHTAVLSTLGSDGAPHLAPMWFAFDGSRILLSTRAGSQKRRNVDRDDRVSFTLVDPTNPFHYVEVRGTATVTDDPDYALRDTVIRRYGHEDGSAFDPPGTQRVALHITPTRILGR